MDTNTPENGNEVTKNGDQSNDYSKGGEKGGIMAWLNDQPPEKRRNIILGTIIALAVIVMLLVTWLAGRADSDDQQHQEDINVSAPADQVPSGDTSRSLQNNPDGSGGQQGDSQAPNGSESQPDATNGSDGDTAPDNGDQQGSGESGLYREDTQPGLAFRSSLGEVGPSANNSAENNSRAEAASRVTDTIVHDPNIGPDGFSELNTRLQNDAGISAGDSVAAIYNQFQMLDITEDMVFASRATTPVLVATETPGVYEIKYLVAGALLPNSDAAPQNVGELTQRMNGELDAMLDGGAGTEVTFTVNTNENVLSVNTPRWW